MPLPRLMRISTVSAWSSSVCAVRMCAAPALRAARGEQAVARRARRLLQAGRRLVAAPAQGAMRDAELARQPRHRRRLALGFLAQAVIDVTAISFGLRFERLAPARRQHHQRGGIRSAGNREHQRRQIVRDRRKAIWLRRPETWLIATSSAAVGTLLFLRDAALHARRGARKFAPDFGERGAGRFLLIRRGERLAEPQQRVRRLAGVLDIWSRPPGRIPPRRDSAGAGTGFRPANIARRGTSLSSGYLRRKSRKACSASA